MLNEPQHYQEGREPGDVITRGCASFFEDVVGGFLKLLFWIVVIALVIGVISLVACTPPPHHYSRMSEKYLLVPIGKDAQGREVWGWVPKDTTYKIKKD